jgi:TolB protein
VINPDGTNAKVITDWFGQLSRVTWSSDSRRIVFGGFEYMSSDKLYIINSDGTGLSVLFNYTQGCYSPSWSPDGKLIAFSSFANIDSTDYSKIFTFDVNNSKINQITSGKTFDNDPTWSSDSKTILYSSSPPGLSAKSSIYSININNSKVVRITDSLGTDYNVSWFN